MQQDMPTQRQLAELTAAVHALGAQLGASVAMLSAEIHAANAALEDTLRAEVQEVQEGVQEALGEVQELREEVQEVKGEVEEMREEVQEVKSEVEDACRELEGLLAEVQELRGVPAPQRRRVPGRAIRCADAVACSFRFELTSSRMIACTKLDGVAWTAIPGLPSSK